MTLAPVAVQIVNKASTMRDRIVTHGIRLNPGELTNRATELMITDGVGQDRVQWEPFHDTRHPDGSFMLIAVHYPVTFAPQGTLQATISEGTVATPPTFSLASSVVAASSTVTLTLTIEGESRSVTLATILAQALEATPLADGSIGGDNRSCLRRYIWRQRWTGVTNQRLRGVWWEVAYEAHTQRDVGTVTFTWGYSAAQSGIRLGNPWNDKILLLTTPATLTISGCGAFFHGEDKVFRSVTRGVNTCTWVLRDPAMFVKNGNVVQGASHCYEGELLFGALALDVPTTNDDRSGVEAIAMDWPTKGIPPFDVVPELPPYIPTREEAIARLLDWELKLWSKGRDADPISWSGTISNANTGNTGDVDIGFGTMRLWITMRAGYPAGLGPLKRDIRQEYIRPNNNRQFNATADLWRYEDFPTLQLWNGVPFYTSESTHSPDMLGINGPDGALGIAEWDCPETVANGNAYGWDRQHAMLMVQMTVALLTANYSVLRFFRQQEQIWLGNCDVTSESVGVLSNEAARSFGRGIISAGVDLWYVTGSQAVFDTLRGRVQFAWEGNLLQGIDSSYYHSPRRNGPQPPNTQGGFEDIFPPNPPQSGNLETVRHTFPWQNAMAARGAFAVALLFERRLPATDPHYGMATVIAADVAHQVTMFGWLDVRGLAPDRYRAVLIDRPYDDYRNPNGYAAIAGRTVVGAVSGSTGVVVGIIETDMKVGPGGITCWALWVKDCTGAFGAEALTLQGSAFTCNAVLELGGFVGAKALQNPDNYVPLSKAQLERTVLFSALQPRPNNQIHAILDVAREANPLVTLVPPVDQHFLVTGDVLRITDEPTWTELNGDWVITVVAQNTVRLQGVDTSARPSPYVANEQIRVARRVWHNMSVKPYTGYGSWQWVAAAIALRYARLGIYGARNPEVIAKAQAVLQFVNAGRVIDPPPDPDEPRWNDADEHCAATPNVFAAEPTPPIALSARGSGPNAVTLTWTNTWAGVVTDIQFRQAGTETWSDAPTTAPNAASAVVGGLALRTSYEFRIRSRTTNPVWSSAWVGPVSATTQGNAPPPVENLAAVGATSTSISASWTNPATNADTTEVEYRQVGAPAWTALAPLPPTTLVAVIPGLLPATQYEVRVRNVNASGASVWAGPVAASTLAGAPTAPTGLGVTPASSTSLNVVWTNTSVTQTAVEIQYQRTTETAWTSAPNVGGAATNTTITGLTPATAYRVRIRSSNASGPSDWVGPVTATTTDVAPTAPTGLTVVGDSSTTISASWTNTATNATTIETRVRVSPAGSWSTGAPLPPTRTSILVPNLTPATAYDFEVRAVNAVGASAWVSGTASTLAGAPGAPTSPIATGSGSTVVNLTWTLGTGTPTSHETQIRELGSTTWRVGPTVAGNATAASFTSLRPGTVFECQVRARNAAGPSAWSATASATTNPGPPAQVAPDAPTDLRLFPVEANEILVTWTALATNALGHEVQFRLNGTQNWVPAGTAPVGEGSLSITSGILPGKVYEVRVRAFHATGVSAWLGPKPVQAGMETAITGAAWIDLLNEVIAVRVAGGTMPSIVVRGKEITRAPLGELKRLLEDAFARQGEFTAAVGTTWMRLGRIR